jgi:aldose 1-epimerase
MKQQHYRAKDGREVHICSLASGSGLRVILALGRIRAALEATDRQGRSANIALGPGSLSYYAYVSAHFGAIAERNGIRIGHGCFTFDDVEYRPETNAGPNAVGSDELVALSFLSTDGEGSSGNLAGEVIFGLGAANERVDYAETTDRPTIVNLTNHSYFNLAIEGSGNFPGHIVPIECSKLDLRTHARRCRG